MVVKTSKVSSLDRLNKAINPEIEKLEARQMMSATPAALLTPSVGSDSATSFQPRSRHHHRAAFHPFYVSQQWHNQCARQLAY